MKSMLMTAIIVLIFFMTITLLIHAVLNETQQEKYFYRFNGIITWITLVIMLVGLFLGSNYGLKSFVLIIFMLYESYYFFIVGLLCCAIGFYNAHLAADVLKRKERLGLCIPGLGLLCLSLIPIIEKPLYKLTVITLSLVLVLFGRMLYELIVFHKN